MKNKINAQWIKICSFILWPPEGDTLNYRFFFSDKRVLRSSQQLSDIRIILSLILSDQHDLTSHRFYSEGQRKSTSSSNRYFLFVHVCTYLISGLLLFTWFCLIDPTDHGWCHVNQLMDGYQILTSGPRRVQVQSFKCQTGFTLHKVQKHHLIIPGSISSSNRSSAGRRTSHSQKKKDDLIS